MKRLIIALGVSSLIAASTSFSYADSKAFSLTTDVQYIDEVRPLKTAAIHSSSNVSRIYLGGEYQFSEYVRGSAKFPVVFHQYQAKYSFPGLASSSYSSNDIYTDRLRAGLEGKLFLDTILGQISWLAMGYFPTMRGFDSLEYEFYNHPAVKVGLKNVLPIADQRGFVTASSAYTLKFEKELPGETRDFGDEISASLGVGYFFYEKFSPMVAFHAATVFPMKRRIGRTEIESKSATAIHVAPALSYSLNENFSIWAHSKILLHRTEIKKLDTGHLWGNLEDEGNLSLQLGLRLGIL